MRPPGACRGSHGGQLRGRPTGDVQGSAPTHLTQHAGEGQGHPQPDQHLVGSLRGAEEQTSGATHTQHPGPVYPHPVGRNKKKWHGSKGRGGGHPRGGQGSSRGGGQGQKSLCDKHEKFGKYAHYCSSPKTCSLPENK